MRRLRRLVLAAVWLALALGISGVVSRTSPTLEWTELNVRSILTAFGVWQPRGDGPTHLKRYVMSFDRPVLRDVLERDRPPDRPLRVLCVDDDDMSASGAGATGGGGGSLAVLLGYQYPHVRVTLTSQFQVRPNGAPGHNSRSGNSGSGTGVGRVHTWVRDDAKRPTDAAAHADGPPATSPTATDPAAWTHGPDSVRARVVWLAPDLEPWPFGEGEFDVVLCWHVLERWRHDPSYALLEARRVLTVAMGQDYDGPDDDGTHGADDDLSVGLLLLSTPNVDAEWACVQHMGQTLAHPYASSGSGSSSSGSGAQLDARRSAWAHARQYKPLEVRTLLYHAGLHVDVHTSFDPFHPPLQPVEGGAGMAGTTELPLQSDEACRARAERMRIDSGARHKERQMAYHMEAERLRAQRAAGAQAHGLASPPPRREWHPNPDTVTESEQWVEAYKRTRHVTTAAPDAQRFPPLLYAGFPDQPLLLPPGTGGGGESGAAPYAHVPWRVDARYTGGRVEYEQCRVRGFSVARPGVDPVALPPPPASSISIAAPVFGSVAYGFGGGGGGGASPAAPATASPLRWYALALWLLLSYSATVCVALWLRTVNGGSGSGSGIAAAAAEPSYHHIGGAHSNSNSHSSGSGGGGCGRTLARIGCTRTVVLQSCVAVVLLTWLTHALVQHVVTSSVRAALDATAPDAAYRNDF